jgi:hypothetical protein
MYLVMQTLVKILDFRDPQPNNFGHQFTGPFKIFDLNLPIALLSECDRVNLL